MKTDVYLINGFLGSGKTSTLLKCMQYFKMMNKKYAIILNELGNANLEQHLFEDESLFELLNGCVCCSVKDDLRTTLDEVAALAHNQKIDIVLLEGTGVANPSEIIDTFQEERFKEHFRLKESICVVDGLRVSEYTSIFSSTKEVRQLQKEQIERGSLLILNKMDQLTEKAAIEKAEKIIRKYNKQAPIIHTAYGDGITLYLDGNDTTIPLPKEAEGGHHHHHHHHHIKAVKLHFNQVASKQDILTMLEQYEDKLFRAKGIVKIKEDKEWYHFQYASGLMEWQKLDKSPHYAGEIVLIGDNLQKEELHI
ncbi:CobW family GTP-binding protein [Niallia taxi]|uniref:CobW family GTP-binding protein n=1 Tax=Niallia taxi TaxID=2499688 RepID=UPI00300944CE